MRSDTASRPTNAFPGVLRFCWRALCVPVYAFLALLEPVVSIVLSVLAVLGVCMSILLNFLRPDFPFWTMLTISLSFFVVLMFYYLLMRLVEPRSE